MCGLVCLWNIDDLALAQRMTDRIQHRGGDALHVRRIDGLPAIMGHARLSIIGTEMADQPIAHPGAAIVANGEILNHHALRAALGKELFLTDSDCETILAAFRSAHPRWIAEPDGMFAFVIATPERVIAARDPLGIKPLYIGHRGEGLAFASELKAFDGEHFDDVTAIAPGTLFDSETGTRQWFRMPPGAATGSAGEMAISDADVALMAKELRAVLEAAVAKWLVADVEVGCFLSGGLDSSIVAALAQQQLGSTLKTFAVGTRGSPDLAAARKVAEHIGSEHHETYFTAEDLADAVPHVVRAMETTDPDTVRSGLPTYFVTRLARAHVKTVLSGEGADELFAGTPTTTPMPTNRGPWRMS